MIRLDVVLVVALLLVGCGKSNAINASSISSISSSSSASAPVSSSSVSKINAWFSQKIDTSTNTLVVKYNILNEEDSNFIYINSVTCSVYSVYGTRLDATITINNDSTPTFILPHKIISGTVVAVIHSTDTPRMVLFVVEVIELDERIVKHTLTLML